MSSHSITLCANGDLYVDGIPKSVMDNLLRSVDAVTTKISRRVLQKEAEVVLQKLSATDLCEALSTRQIRSKSTQSSTNGVQSVRVNRWKGQKLRHSIVLTPQGMLVLKKKMKGGAKTVYTLKDPNWVLAIAQRTMGVSLQHEKEMTPHAEMVHYRVADRPRLQRIALRVNRYDIDLRYLIENLSCSDQAFVAQELFHQLKQTEEMQVLHGDIKPENILVNCKNTLIFPSKVSKLELGDWGSWTLVGGERKDIMDTCGYRAPEVIMRSSALNFARSDVFSAGVTMWEVFALGSLPEVSTFQEDLKRIRVELPGKYWREKNWFGKKEDMLPLHPMSENPGDLKDLLLCMMWPAEEERLTMAQAGAWFKQLDARRTKLLKNPSIWEPLPFRYNDSREKSNSPIDHVITVERPECAPSFRKTVSD
jgi:hypothetical protein